MKQILIMTIVALVEVSAFQNCTSEKCCWVEIPEDYCSITLPTKPLDVWTRFNVMKFEEINEAKQSYTVNLRWYNLWIVMLVQRSKLPIRILLAWRDHRFKDDNMTREQFINCYPGIVRKEQIDAFWIPDIYFEGEIDQVMWYYPVLEYLI